VVVRLGLSGHRPPCPSSHGVRIVFVLDAATLSQGGVAIGGGISNINGDII
jgi:hypothetical protein